jgi:hypothetical protein
MRVHKAERANEKHANVGPKTKTSKPGGSEWLTSGQDDGAGDSILRDLVNPKILNPLRGAKPCG